jgi:centrosomal protein CEP104
MQKLTFAITTASSHDQDFHQNNLLVQNHNPLATGWQSQRFCLYPQELVLALTPGNCRIQKLQLLAHHFKIPTKIELYCGKTRARLDSGLENGDKSLDVQWFNLGHVGFSDNYESGYKARELKSINIDAQGEFLKIVVYKCYVNTLNLYNQVGIVALNVLGMASDSDYFVKTLSDPTRTLIGVFWDDN